MIAQAAETAWAKHACHGAPDRDAPGDAQLRQLWKENCELRRRVLDLEAENRRLREARREA